MAGSRRRLANLGWSIAYIVMLAAVVAGVVYGRRQALATYGTEEAQVQWDQWRSGASTMTDGSGPVKRRVPGSAEPPALVLMRDYFAICLGLALVLSTVLFGTFMLFLRGALASSDSRFPTPDSQHR